MLDRDYGKQQFASTLFRSAVRKIFVQVSRPVSGVAKDAFYLTPRRGFKYFDDAKKK